MGGGNDDDQDEDKDVPRQSALSNLVQSSISNFDEIDSQGDGEPEISKVKSKLVIKHDQMDNGLQALNAVG